MKVKFTKSYSGTLTNEVGYTTGQTADLDRASALLLIDAGVAELGAAPMPDPEPEPPKPSKKAKP